MTPGSARRILAILDPFTETRLEWRREEMMAELGHTRPAPRPIAMTGGAP